MSLTKSDLHWHRIYAASSRNLRLIIDDAYTGVTDSILANSPSLRLKNDDRAEALVAAITRYVFESNPDHSEVKVALENAAKEDET